MLPAIFRDSTPSRYPPSGPHENSAPLGSALLRGQLAPLKYARRDIFAAIEMIDNMASGLDVVSDASTASPLATMAVGNVGGEG